MGYRIRIPSKHDTLDEAELLSGAERFGFFLREQRFALLVGFVVLVVAAAVVGGVLWYDFLNITPIVRRMIRGRRTIN